MNLDFDIVRFERLLDQAKGLVIELYGKLDTRPIKNNATPQEIRSNFDDQAPINGTSPEEVLREIIPEVFKNSTLNISPRFFAYVMSGGSQMGIISDLLISALNQNHAKWHIASAAAEIERIVIRWIAEFINYRADAGGVLLSGGSEANLTCLRVARDFMAPQFKLTGSYQQKPLTIYTSEETHSCIEKSVEMLGLGRSFLRKIPVSESFTIRLDLLELRIKEDIQHGLQPFCIVGNAGTVNTGAVDELNALADLAKKYGLWFHVDGAYGSPAANINNEMQSIFKGLDRADSIALDPHKWLQVPFDVGCALIRNWSDLKNTFSVLPPYLKAVTDSEEKWDWMEYTFHLSRNFKALKVWMQFQVYGTEKLKRVIEDNISQMKALGVVIEEAPDFQLMAPVSLSIVCFRYIPSDQELSDEDLDLLNSRILQQIEKLGKFFITGTKIHGKIIFRACSVNHRTTMNDTMDLFEHIREIGSGLC